MEFLGQLRGGNLNPDLSPMVTLFPLGFLGPGRSHTAEKELEPCHVGFRGAAGRILISFYGR